jgi:hypothetical protein
MSSNKQGYVPTPGKAHLFWIDPKAKKHPKQPDFDGVLILTRAYAAGEQLKLSAWKNLASNGNEYVTLQENTYHKDKSEQHTEVKPKYAPSSGSFRKNYDPDQDVPFN